MMAAIQASEKGHDVVLIEKNEKLGKKVYITGKGRCNITNACDIEDFFKNIVHNAKFMYSAGYTWTAESMISLLEEEGCPTKVERGDRVFPQSDHSSDVIKALHDRLVRNHVKIQYNRETTGLLIEDGRITGCTLLKEPPVMADAVILATGGMSYPATGSDGNGYSLAKQAGHTLTKIVPALVPLETEEKWCSSLQGLALKNIGICVTKGNKELYHDFGEMLFTHFGISGPVILSASSYLDAGKGSEKPIIHLDLKPALSIDQLDKRIQHDLEENNNKQFKNSLQKLFPLRLIPVMIVLSGIDPEKKCNVITREERIKFVELIKNVEIHIAKTRGFAEAIITQGGVPVKEINPSTMESKLVKGLFLCGEMIDVDALTGGFNLQVAWSTGYLAGDSIE